MFRLNIKNCKTCKHFYRDGNYNPHCKTYLNPVIKLDSFENCVKWEEKTFSGIFGFITPDKSTIRF